MNSAVGSLALTATFVTLGVMVAIWFVLIKLLYVRLERHHPAKYQAMGRPSLFLRNSPATAWAMLAFIVKREHQSLRTLTFRDCPTSCWPSLRCTSCSFSRWWR
jgi:hypothetical protein